MPDQTRIISASSADGKSRVIEAAFRDFTIDGNGANQPEARSIVGISNVYTMSIVHLRVRIVGVKGTADAECFALNDGERGRAGFLDGLIESQRHFGDRMAQVERS